VSIRIVDESGTPVQGHVEQKLKGQDKLIGHFCGSTRKPMSITPGRDLVVYPGSDPCGGNMTGATQGVVVATFNK
jgi:hypothetical protein